jgi:Phosphopantetheinyl transferase
VYRLIQGKCSQLASGSHSAGRVLLAQALAPAPVPEIVPGPHGKPAFVSGTGLWFNISHSGDEIALLLSDEGEVGCDIEVIRPRKNLQQIVDSVFSHAEQQAFANATDPLTLFWQIWTRKEAMLKQAGGSVWQIAEYDSYAPRPLFLQHAILPGKCALAICTPTPPANAIFNTSAARI